MFHIAMHTKRPLLLEEFCDVYILPRYRDPAVVNMEELRPTNIANVVPDHTANFLEVNKEPGTGNW